MIGKLLATSVRIAFVAVLLGPAASAWAAPSAGAAAVHRTQRAAKPTAAEAKHFVDRAAAALTAEGEYGERASWVRNTYITDDTQWLEAKADAELTTMATGFAKEASRFDGVKVDPVTRRKLEILKRAIVLPAPSRPGAADELATISSRLSSTYATGKFTYNGKTLTLNDAEDVLRTSRNPDELRAVWEGWRTVSPAMRQDYERLVSLANEGARELHYKDTGALWRSQYDMAPDAFAGKVDQLWIQVEPFYRNLHCYVRARLNARYGDSVQPRTGPIRADLVGNMWAQEWGNVYDVVAPKNMHSSYDLEKLLIAQGYDPLKMVHTAENFYSSLGFAPLPATFWTRSQFTRPRDREVVCHASAWDIDAKSDVRVKLCAKVTADDFFTVHHELGHNYYQRAYSDQPFIFRDGANDGFHEAIGDFAGLYALTPTYLHQIGLLDTLPGPEEDIPYLLKMALDRIAFLPFGLLIDKWRWEVFSGQVAPEHYNDAWWDLVRHYQGVVPPGPRPADAFDPGAKFHIADSTPYMRYFLARIYQFQFYRAACRLAGWTGPLNRCSIYGNKDVGAKFRAMLELGQSQPWPKTLAVFTGEHDIDASGIIDYFAPLNTWLTEQNKGESCGW